jgi:hypothetical protein
MSEYTKAVKPVVDDAVKWAGESAQGWFDSYVRLTDAAASGSVTAETAVREMSALVTMGTRDMARVWATWTSLGTALLNLDLPPQGGGAPPKKKSPAKKRAAKKRGGSG